MTDAARAAAAEASAQHVDRTIDLNSPPPGSTRVLITHEVRLFAEVLRVALAERAGLDVLPSIPSLAQSVSAARQARPNVILMDIEGRTADGLATLQELCEAVPEASVLVLTSSADPARLTAAVRAGASGYLTMDAEMSDVVEAIRATAAGKVVLSARRLEVLVRQLARRAETAERGRQAADRARARGAAPARPGQVHQDDRRGAVVSHNTARTHIQNVLTKLQVHSRLEAAARAVREQLV
jgi:DNA-binding NarL/FixJ family response regulator